MGDSQALSSGARTEGETAGEICPNCREPFSPLAAVSVSSIDGARLRRCQYCGCRATDEAAPHYLSICGACGLPELGEEFAGQPRAQCAACRDGAAASNLADAKVAQATEREVRAALSEHLTVKSARSVAQYLKKMVSLVERRQGASGAGGRVAIIDHESLETLALPSGTVLISLGVLRTVHDEAELAFVLGHELAHVAAGDAAKRLVQLGVRALTRGAEAAGPEAWAEAAMDLVKLGFGHAEELDADARAIKTMLALGYDPDAAITFLERVGELVASGDARVEEYALAHPPIRERIRAIDRARFGSLELGVVARVNREVFRRAAGPDVLDSLLQPVDGLDAEETELELQEQAAARARWIRAGLGIAALAGLLAVLGSMLL